MNNKICLLTILICHLLCINCVRKKPQRLSYDVQVQIDPESHHIHGSVTVHNPPDSCFYLNQDFQISNISVHGRSVPYHRIPSDYLPYTVGNAVIMEGDYRGDVLIEYSGAVDGVINGVNMIRPDLVELALYAAWYPLFKNARFYYELKLDLPSCYVATGNGAMKKQQETGGRSNSQWNSFDQSSDIVLIASPQLKRLHEQQPDLEIEIFYDRIPQQYVIAARDSLLKAMRYLTNCYGPVQTKGLLRYVYSPRDGWGYSRVPLFVVPEQFAVDQLDRELGPARVFHGSAHEMAHFWWSIADCDKPDDWINEGLAEFSAFRLSEKFSGQDFADVLVKEYQEHAAHSQTDTSIAETTNYSDDRYVNRYEKTTLIFIEARRRYGEQNLDGFLKDLHKRFAAAADATTEQFLAQAQKQLGSQAGEFFEKAITQRRWIEPVEL